MKSKTLEFTIVAAFLLIGTLSLFLINFSITGLTFIEENTTRQNETTEVQTTPELQNLTNLTVINTTITENIEEKTIQYPAVINKPVKWNKIISLLSPLENITITLPKESDNIKIISEKEHTVKIDNRLTTPNLITGNIILENENYLLKLLKNFFKFTGFSILEEDNVTEVEISGNISDFIIEYETPAPKVIEEKINNKKRITIYSDIHYEDILTYTSLEQEVEQGSAKLYHLIKDTKIEVENAKYLDTNNNSLIDYIEWITPYLSNQTYEIDIIILNVQSFPIVGGYWTVYLNTTGTANLTIKGINGTTFNHTDFNEPDLVFTNLSCGAILQNSSYIDNGIFIENYTCDKIMSLHTVKVMTSGEHVQQFTFGANKTLIAKNIASGGGLLENQTWQGSLLNVSKGSITAGDINGDGNLDLVIVGQNESNSNLSAEVYLNNGSTFLSNFTDWSINITKVGGDASAILGDIDNDNDLDLVVGGDINSNEDGVIYTYLNNGTGFAYSFSYSSNVTPINFRNLDLILEDLDLDGDLDLIAAGDRGSTTNSTAVWLNNGTSFAQNRIWSRNLTRERNPRLAMGDIDNDGYPDLVYTGADGGADINSFYLKIFINNGSELLENATWESNLTQVGNEPYPILGDINNDGNLDLVVTGDSQPITTPAGKKIKTYFNNGTHLNENNSYVRNLTGVIDSALSLADVDNDGDLDLFVSGQAGTCDVTSRVGCLSKLYENNGSEFYENTTWNTNLTAVGVIFGSHLFLDMDKDNDLDLIQIGCTGTCGNGRALTRVFENTIAVDNTAPTSTKTPNLTYSNSQLNISFTNGSDTETTANGLYYNLRVGTTSGGNQTVSVAYGYGSSPSQRMFGNMFNRKEVLLNIADQDYFVAVQTIDAGYKSSTFSTQATYTAPISPNITQLTEIPDPVYENKTLYINATVVDDGTIGTVILQINFSNGTFTNYSTTAAGSNYYNSSVPTKLVGNHSIRWFSNDTNGKANTTELSLFGVKSDSTPPNITSITRTPSTQNITNTIELNVTCADNINSCHTLIAQITMPNGSLQNLSMRNITGNNIWTNSSAITSVGGTYNWTIYANDTVGNINNTENSSFIIQSRITITSNATNLPFNVNGSISGNLSNGSTSSQIENLTFFNTTLGPRAIVTAFFNNSNINLNNITLLGNATATVVNFSQAIGLASTFTMIVPNTLSNGIIICPNVSILPDVNISCPGITTFTLENALSNSTINGLNISLNGNNFWISNVTGTGAGENPSKAASVGTKGTGSSSINTYSTTDLDKINKKEITMTKTTVIPFIINKEKYILNVENIVMDYAVIKINPTDINIKIQKGETKQLDVNKDSVNDLKIFLKEVISASKLDLVIERINSIQESEIRTDESETEEFTKEEKPKIQAPMQEENQDNDLINTRKPITTILIFLALLVFLVIELYEKKSSIKNTLKDIKQKFKK